MIATVPGIIKSIFPGIRWSYPSTEKKIYLTFDDGPHPEITPWVLEQLKSYNAKATFFCIGNNVAKYPSVVEETRSLNNSIGNHTYDHLNGWKTSLSDYILNVKQCNKLVEADLFRPPYGKISPLQYLKLKKEFEIVLWDVISYDFDKSISQDACLKIVTGNLHAGSIVVFHDSEKAYNNLKYVLPRFLDLIHTRGFTTEIIKKA